MNEIKRKGAFLIPSLEAGGMERVMIELVRYFSENTELEVHLIVYGKPALDYYDIAPKVVVHKPDFIFTESRRTLSTMKTVFFIRKTVNKINPEFVLSFGEYWNVFILISLLGIKVPIYLSDRSSPEKSLGTLHDFLRRILYPFATGIIVQTTGAKEIFKTKYTNKNVQVIGNPIRSIIKDSDIKTEKIVLSIGRLITTKNFNRLIDIFANTMMSDWKMIIVGGDSNKEKNRCKLQAQIDRLGMSDTIILAGTQKNIEEYLLRARIFAFTSSSEGFPNVIGEALSAGLPVVSYDCIAGPSDMIIDGANGFLIPLYDDQLFTEKLRYLMVNDNVRVSMSALAQKSVEKFSVNKIGAVFYQFLLNKTK